MLSRCRRSVLPQEMGTYSITYYVTVCCCYWWTRLASHTTHCTRDRWTILYRTVISLTVRSLSTILGARCNQIIIIYLIYLLKPMNANQMHIDLQRNESTETLNRNKLNDKWIIIQWDRLMTHYWHFKMFVALIRINSSVPKEFGAIFETSHWHAQHFMAICSVRISKQNHSMFNTAPMQRW